MFASEQGAFLERLFRGSILMPEGFRALVAAAGDISLLAGGPQRLGIEPGMRRSVYLYEPVLIAKTAVAGVKFYKGKNEMGRLTPGRRVALVRERRNRYDKWAVEVYAPGWVKIGYVPRFAARMVAGELDRGAPVVAKITSADIESGTLVVGIYVLKPTFLTAGEKSGFKPNPSFGFGNNDSERLKCKTAGAFLQRVYRNAYKRTRIFTDVGYS